MSPMVWMLSAVGDALFRQRCIAALMLFTQIMIFILALLKLLACHEEKVSQEEYFRARRPSCASNSFLWLQERGQFSLVSFVSLCNFRFALPVLFLRASMVRPIRPENPCITFHYVEQDFWACPGSGFLILICMCIYGKGCLFTAEPRVIE